jgi:tetratricopeptide (TPR) repeat protein
VAALLAQVLCDAGRYDEAEELTRASEEAARPNDVHANVRWRSTRARLLARAGNLDAAEDLAREAVAFATDSDFLNTHADTLMDQAEVLRLAGRGVEARVAIEEAIALYEQKGNAVSAATARAALDP